MANNKGKKQEGSETLRVNIQKWGRPLVEAGWTLVPNTIIERQKKLGLEAMDINILLHLMSYWWEPGNKPHPSKSTIADAMGISPRTVQRRITRMVSAGFIERERRQGLNGTQTNRYHLEGLIKAAEPYAKEAIKERKAKKERVGRMTAPIP